MSGVLLKAVSAERVRQVRLLLDSGISTDHADDCGQTALIRAIFVESKPSRERILRFLLQHGALVSKADVVGRNALAWSCLYGQHREVRLLLKYGDVDLDLNSTDINGQTALFHATSSGNAAAVKLIVDGLQRYGLSADLADRQGITPLMQAVKQGHDVCASILIHQGGATVGATLETPQEVTSCGQRWASQCPTQAVTERTKAYIERHEKQYQNSPRGRATGGAVTTPRGMSQFPPILPPSCVRVIRQREETARRNQIQTSIAFAGLDRRPRNTSDAHCDEDSTYGSDSSLYMDQSGADDSSGSTDAGRHVALRTPGTPLSIRTVSKTSSTEAHAESSDDDDEVDGCSRPVHEKKPRPTAALPTAPHCDLQAMYRIYEDQHSAAYRPGAARAADRARMVDLSPDTAAAASAPITAKITVRKQTKQEWRTLRKLATRTRVSIEGACNTVEKARASSRHAPLANASGKQEKLFIPTDNCVLPTICKKSNCLVREESFCTGCQEPDVTVWSG